MVLCNVDSRKLYLPGKKTLKRYTDNFSYSGEMIWNTIRPECSILTHWCHRVLTDYIFLAFFMLYLRKRVEVSSSKQNKSGHSSFRPCSPQKTYTSCILKYFGLKIYRNEYWMDNNGKTGSDFEATRLVLWYNRVPV